jgi:integrase
MKTKGLQITPELLRALAQQLEGTTANLLDAPAPPKARSPSRRKPKSTIKSLTGEELERLFAAIRKHGDARNLALFEVAYHRGLRVSEVGLLTMGHLRLPARRLQVDRLKNGNAAEYPLSDREVKALKGWLRIRGEAAGPLFGSRNHRPIGRRMLHKWMQFYGRLAELPPDKRHFHVLRHSCAVQLVERDIDILVIQDHLGHADIRNTAIYAKVGDKKRRQIGEKLAREW